MKVRKGFVSNSSSSSFVIIGVVLNEISDRECLIKRFDVKWKENMLNWTNEYKYTKDELKDKYFGDFDEYLKDNKEYIYNEYFCENFTDNLDMDIIDDESNVYLGSVISDNGDDYMESNIIDIKKIIIDVEEKFKKLGITEEIQLITGTRPC